MKRVNVQDEYREIININEINKSFGKEFIPFDDLSYDVLLLLTDTKKIKPKNEGILELKEGESVVNMPLSHFIKLARSKGKAAVMRALNNLERWNKNKNPSFSQKIKDLKNRLKNNSEWKNL